MRLEMDAMTVAEPEVDSRSPAHRLDRQRLELSRGFQDLVELLLFPARFAIAVQQAAPIEVLNRAHMAPVHKDYRQTIQSFFILAGFGVSR